MGHGLSPVTPSAAAKLVSILALRGRAMADTSASQAAESGSRNPEVKASPNFVSSVTFCLASVFASLRLGVRSGFLRFLCELLLKKVPSVSAHFCEN
jgi:hypothetical protein